MTPPHGSQRGAALQIQREMSPEPATRPTRQAPDLRVAPQPAQAAPQVAARETAASAPKARPVHKRGSAFENATFPVLLLIIGSAIATGWFFRDQLKIEAEHGVGYALGIAGVSCVGILLIYPLRKRISWLRFIGTVPAWFHFHMALGLLAPTLILFHAGFRTGSANAAIALASMLVVAGSGLLGRMLYVRIHRDLASKRAEVRAMAQDAGFLRQTLISEFVEVADLADKLEATLRKPRPNVFSAFAYALSTSARISTTRRKMLKALNRGARRVAEVKQGGKAAARRLKRDGAMLVRAYCNQMRHAAYLTFFERLFALWHIVHMPLFMLMVVATVIHIVAVHLY